MAIDFSQVKTITMPEGSVTKITDSNGNVLWQGAGWHTVFEGSFSKTINSNSGRPVINICNLVDCEAPLKLRITGSINTDIYNPKVKFNWLGESEQDQWLDKSTLKNINKEITIEDTGIPASDRISILQCKCYRWRYENLYIHFYLRVNQNNNVLIFYVWDNKLDENSVTLNITKVEQYY